MSKIGQWLFIIGIILTILFSAADTWRIIDIYSLYIVEGIIFAFGLIVGFLNLKIKEANSFLIALIAFLLIGFIASDSGYQSLGSSDIFVSGVGLVIATKQILRNFSQ